MAVACTLDTAVVAYGQAAGAQSGVEGTIVNFHRFPASAARRRDATRAVALCCLLCLSATALGGCATPAIPALAPAPGTADTTPVTLHPSPTVAQLVDHIRCALRGAIHDGLNDPTTRDSFYRLIKYNFVATPDLTVKVTNTEGLSPSLAFIDPTTSLTLSASGQVNGTQDRNFDFTYAIDLAKVVSSDDMTSLAAEHPELRIKEVSGVPSRDNACESSQGTTNVHGKTYSDGLAGDLALGQTLRNGLSVMETTAAFNIYGAGGPNSGEEIAEVQKKAAEVQVKIATATGPDKGVQATRALKNALTSYSEAVKNAVTVAPSLSQSGKDDLSAQLSANASALSLPQDVKAAPTVTKALASARAQTEAAAASVQSANGPASIGAEPPGHAKQSGASQATTKFGSTIEFTVVMSGGGGLNWALKDFKGPSGSGNLLNASRTYFDTLAIAFVATCQNGKPGPVESYWDTVPDCADNDQKSTAIASGIAAGQSLVQEMRLLNLQQALQQLGGGITP
jgi:hypothetical protein